MSTEKPLKHIVVSKDNFERLSKLGYAGQSFNDVITKVLKIADAKVADPKEIRDSK